MADRSAVCAGIVRSSFGTHLLDHLAADGAGLAGGEIAVVAFLEVDAHLGGGFHLELVHRGLGFRDIDLIVVLSRHDIFSFLIDDFLSFVVRFGYRKGSLTRIRADMRALRW